MSDKQHLLMAGQSSFFPFLLNNQAEQERLRYAIQAAQVGTWHLDVSRQQVWWDERCQELYGYQEEAVVTYQQWLSLVHPDDKQRIDEAIKGAFDPSSSGHFEVQFRTVEHPAGSSRWLNCQGRAYVDVLGAAYRLSGVARDITAQVQTNQQLEASKARLRSLVLSSPTPTVLFVGRDLVIDTVNEPMLQIWGKDASVTGQLLPQAVPDLVSQPLLEQLLNVYDTKEVDHNPSRGQARVVFDKLWQQSWFNFSYNPVYAQDGTIFGFIHTATDVTGEVLALQQLQESEVRFRALVEEAPVATCLLVGSDLRIEVANESMLSICGKGKEVLGLPLLHALPELEGQPFLTILTNVLTSQETYSAQGMQADLLVNEALSTYYVDWTAKPLANEQGDAYALLLMATDVTRQVLARQLIQRSEEQKAFLLQLTDQLRALPSPAAVYEQAARLVGTYLGADRVGYAHDGGDGQSVVVLPNYTHDADDWQGRHPYATYVPLLLDFEASHPIVRSDVANDPTLTKEQKETLRVRRLGASFAKPLAIKGRPATVLFVHYQQAHVWTTDELMLLDDVSARLIIAVERAEAEQALRESEQRYRLLSEELEHRVAERTGELVQANQDLKRSNDNLQQFAYVASHDLQEPLRKIQSFSTMLSSQLDGQVNATAKDYLQRITAAGSRMSTLIKDLLTYSRIATRQQAYGPISLGAVIDGVLENLSFVVTERSAQISVDELPILNGDELQLSQLFQNLVSNALKFTPAGQIPRIQITYHQRSQSELPASVHPSKLSPFYHQISVHDQGVGFDIRYLDRIFQVFQRLHSQHEFAGTGVGLAICQRVVENHGGAITAASQPNEGATFSVFLPL